MQLTILGSNGTYPTAGRPASGYLVTHQGSRLWMDAGSGTYGALAAEMDPTDLDAIFLSHRHPDHCADIFASFTRWRTGQRTSTRFPSSCQKVWRIVSLRLSARRATECEKSSTFVPSTAGMEITIASFDIAIAEAYPPPAHDRPPDLCGRNIADLYG